MSLVTLLKEVDRRFEVLQAKPEGTLGEPEFEDMSFLLEASIVLRGQSSQIETLAKRLQGLADALDGQVIEPGSQLDKAVRWARHALRSNGPMALHTPPTDGETK